MVNIRRSHRRIQMVQSDHLFLCVHSCAAFACAAKQNSYFSCVHFIEKSLFLFCRIIVVNKGYFLFGNTFFHQLVFNIVIDIKLLRRHILYMRHFQFFEKFIRTARIKFAVLKNRRFGYDLCPVIVGSAYYGNIPVPELVAFFLRIF